MIGMPDGWYIAATGHAAEQVNLYAKRGSRFQVKRCDGYWVLAVAGVPVTGPHGSLRRFKSAASAARAADKEAP